MNINQVKKTLPVLMKHNIVPLLWGAQGVGKTQIVKQLAKELNLQFVCLHLASQEVGDLIGLLKEMPDGTVDHLRPKWFPTEGKGIIFLDEISRASPDVLQTMFPFILEGALHQHKLPSGWKIIAASNHDSNNFAQTKFNDKAWVSRFCHIDFTPSPEEFITFIESKNSMIADLLRTHPEFATNNKDSFDYNKLSPNNRSLYDFILPLEQEESIENERYEIYSGILGKIATTTLLSFKQKSHEKLSGKKILNDYKNCKGRVKEASSSETVQFDLLNSAFEEILAHLNTNPRLKKLQLDNFKEFLIDIPLELTLKCINSIRQSNWKKKGDLTNDENFAKLLTLTHRKSNTVPANE